MHSSEGSRVHQCKPSPLDELDRIDRALDYCRHLANVRTFVNGRPHAAITLAVAAQAIGISQSHLARLFQERVGTSFHRWLTLRRVHTAIQLMHERPLTALQAAHLSGFASYRSFARAFREIVGFAPSIYRKQVRQCRSGRTANN